MNKPVEVAEVRQLPNGLTVVCQQNRHAPVVALQVWVGVGSADEDEPAGEAGLAHVHEHMLFKGTARRGVGELARAIEGAGGEINAWTSFDNTVYYVVLASRYFDTGLDVLADAIQNSAFDADELEREREVVIEEIKRSLDIPARMVSQRLFDTAYQAHPYGRPVIGNAESVRAMGRDQLLGFYRRHYRPERLTVVAVGDFEPERAFTAIAAAFGEAPRGEGPAPDRPVEPAQSSPRLHLGFGDTRETHLACAWHIPAVDHADVPALDVLSVVLGHGESSQLSRDLRFRRRLVNDAYAYAYTPRDAGLLIAGAALHHDRLLDATRAVVGEVSKLADETVTVRELDKAKTIIDSEAVYQRETAQGVARKLGFFQAVLGDLAEEPRYYAAVREVQAADLQRVARRYLRPELLSCVALLPRDQEGQVHEEELAEAAAGPRQRPRPPRLGTAGKSGCYRSELASGAKLLVLPDHSVPVVSFRLVWLAGQRAESAADAGVGNLVAQLLTKGTASRSALDIAHAVDAMAASLDGFSGRNTLGVHAEFLSRFADQGFDLLVDCAQRPAFRAEDVDRERAQVLEQLRAREDDLPSLAFRLFARALYPQHPYQLDPLGSRRSVEALDVDSLRRVHARHAVSDRAVVVIAGDIDPERAVALAHAGFGEPPEQPSAPLPSLAADPPPAEPRVVRLARDRAQAHLLYGFMGRTFDSDDRYGLEVLGTVLSGQSGRLFLDLRDRRSLAYSVSALSVEGVEPGYFAVYMGTSPEKVEEALQGVEEHLARLRSEPPDPDELERTRRFLIGSHEIGLQRVGARASVMAFNERYGIGHEAHLDYARRIEAVDRDDLVRLAEQVLDPQHSVLAIVGPEDCGGPAATLELDEEPGEDP